MVVGARGTCVPELVSNPPVMVCSVCKSWLAAGPCSGVYMVQREDLPESRSLTSVAVGQEPRFEFVRGRSSDDKPPSVR